MGRSHPKPVVGLIGGIGSGKSLVARQFAALGAAVFDADCVAKQLLEKDDVRDTLIRWWGHEILKSDGSLDHAAVADRIFSDASQRHRLESLLHPLVAEKRQQFINQAQQNPHVNLIILDVPLLVEVHWESKCDRLIFVQADPEVRQDRVRNQRGWKPGELERREKNQFPLDRKLALADDIINNNAGEEHCLAQVQNVYSRILALS